jgi:hypothetical protein
MTASPGPQVARCLELFGPITDNDFRLGVGQSLRRFKSATMALRRNRGTCNGGITSLPSLNKLDADQYDFGWKVWFSNAQTCDFARHRRHCLGEKIFLPSCSADGSDNLIQAIAELQLLLPAALLSGK